MEILTKRIYEAPDEADGMRVLVDRLWPRGMSKERANLAAWDKDVAPSGELRKAWGHDPATFDNFKAAYRAELDASGAAARLLARAHDAGAQRLTLLFAAKSPTVNHAVVLAGYLEGLEQAEGPARSAL